MSRLQWSGLMIHQHTAEGFKLLGRIIHEDLESGRYFWIPFPEKDKHSKRVKHYIKAPLVGYRSELEKRLGVEEGQVSLVEYQPEGLLTHAVTTLREMAADELRKDRADIHRSLAIMDEQWAWIEPLVVGNTIDDLLNKDTVHAFAKLREKSIGIDARRIVRAVRLYLLHGLCQEALLPRWDRCNLRGSVKLPRLGADEMPMRRAGRKNIAVLSGLPEHAGIALRLGDRERIQKGYRKYMRPGVTVAHAFALTLAEFWPAAVTKTPSGLQIKILPIGQIPSLSQFRRHGPGRAKEMSASRINLGQHRWARDERVLRGTAKGELVLACQRAMVDSTPEDQNLVAQDDPLVLMPQSYNTKVVETYTGYIAGFYSGYERPSTLTTLMAIGHAGHDKVAYCARYGIEITPDQWLALNFKIVQGDNGEAKSEEGIHAMTGAEISAEFTKAYAAELKGPVESAHNVLARGAGHLMEGSSQGRRPERGDKNPAKDACQTHDRYMNAAIRKILFHNNIEPVEHLLTVEMRADHVKPTRGSVLQWLLEKGYVPTTATDQQTLRTRCLPWLHGVIRRDGIRLFDPRTNKDRLIPHLRFSSDALHDTGLTAIGRNASHPCRVHIEPNFLGKAWLAYNGTTELELQTTDPAMATMTLAEWLRATDNDRLVNFLDSGHRTEVRANDGKSIYDSNKQARARRVKAVKEAAADRIGDLPRHNKREAGDAAIHQAKLEKFGIAPSQSSSANVRKLAPMQLATFAAAAPSGANDHDYMAMARKRAAKP